MVIQAKISQEFAVTALLDSNNSLLALGTVSAMIRARKNADSQAIGKFVAKFP